MDFQLPTPFVQGHGELVDAGTLPAGILAVAESRHTLCVGLAELRGSLHLRGGGHFCVWYFSFRMVVSRDKPDALSVWHFGPKTGLVGLSAEDSKGFQF